MKDKDVYKEVYTLRKTLKICEEAFRDIRMVMICIGGGLNDNVKGYTKEQMKDLFEMDTIAKYTIEGIKEEENKI